MRYYTDPRRTRRASNQEIASGITLYGRGTAPEGYFSAGSTSYTNKAGTQTFNVFKPLPQAETKTVTEYKTDPEQAKTIADLQSRLDALTKSTKARELELANAPEPVPGITQEEVDKQLGNLRRTLGSQYGKEREQALTDLRSQLTGQFATELVGLRESLGAQSQQEMQDLRSRLGQESADKYAALRETLTSDFQRQLSEATSASEKAMLEQKQAAALQAADYTAQLSEARRKNEAQENLFQTNIDALKTELGMARQNYGSQIKGLRGELSSAQESYRTALSGLEQTIGAQNERLAEYQAAVKRSQEAEIQRQQRARISDAYANPNRQKVTGVKASRSPAFASSGLRRTVSSQFGRSGMRISSLNI
tara:strand:- start:2111 stop:3208 length:1098 start_codon:yes stop_codon:yes gene_type:complete